jgi:hypothetical protein
MMLINSLLAHATDTYWEAFINKLDALNTRKAVIVCPLTSDYELIDNHISVINVIAYSRPYILRARLSNQHGTCDVQNENNVCRSGRRARTR